MEINFQEIKKIEVKVLTQANLLAYAEALPLARDEQRYMQTFVLNCYSSKVCFFYRILSTK